MNNEPKKKSHWKFKLVLGVIAALFIVGIGFIMGLRMQSAYNRFLYNAGASMASLYLYGFLFIAVLALALIAFIFFKLRKR